MPLIPESLACAETETDLRVWRRRVLRHGLLMWGCSSVGFERARTGFSAATGAEARRHRVSSSRDTGAMVPPVLRASATTDDCAFAGQEQPTESVSDRCRGLLGCEDGIHDRPIQSPSTGDE